MMLVYPVTERVDIAYLLLPLCVVQIVTCSVVIVGTGWSRGLEWKPPRDLPFRYGTYVCNNNCWTSDPSDWWPFGPV